jgi:hypothetical protein
VATHSSITAILLATFTSIVSIAITTTTTIIPRVSSSELPPNHPRSTDDYCEEQPFLKKQEEERGM